MFYGTILPKNKSVIKNGGHKFTIYMLVASVFLLSQVVIALDFRLLCRCNETD